MKYAVNILIILIHFILGGCGGGNVNGSDTAVLNTDDSASISYSWNKVTESSYSLKANGKNIGLMNIQSNWIFFNDLYKNDSDRLIAKDEGMSPLSISWPQLKKYQINIDAIDFKQISPAHMQLEVKMHFYMDSNGSGIKIPHYTKMIVWKSKSSGFYNYEMDSSLSISQTASETFFKEHQILEYQDILFEGIFKFPVYNEKWNWFVYRENGQNYRLPLHHHNIYNELPIPSRGGAYFALENDERVGNPVITMSKGADRDYFILCTWAYDLHFYIDAARAKEIADADKPITVNYLISFQTSNEIKSQFDNTKLSPLVETKRFKVPAYAFDHVNKFEYSELYKTPNQHYFWYCFSDWEYCEWDLQEGYLGGGSLKIDNKTKRISSWKYAALTPSHMENFVLKNRYQLSALVKTRGATGAVKIGWADDNNKEIAYTQLLVTGDTGWTPISLFTPNTSGAYGGVIYLELDGQGEVWFDDVTLKEVYE